MKRILIVDDSPDIRQLVRLVLGRKYQVGEAGDAHVAFEIARRDVPNLIVLDVMLPGGMNGLELLGAIRQVETLREVPVVMVSGRCEPEDHETAMQAGACAYFIKPFSPLRLADYIDELLN